MDRSPSDNALLQAKRFREYTTFFYSILLLSDGVYLFRTQLTSNKNNPYTDRPSPYEVWREKNKDKFTKKKPVC